MDGKKSMLLTNVWAIYRFNEDGSVAEPAFATMGRPQDWGDPQKWKYKAYTLTAEINGTEYTNQCHCWAELPITDSEHLELFAPLVAQIMIPGTPVELCSNKLLAEDDFWMEKWGAIPNYFEAEYEDY